MGQLLAARLAEGFELRAVRFDGASPSAAELVMPLQWGRQIFYLAQLSAGTVFAKMGCVRTLGAKDKPPVADRSQRSRGEEVVAYVGDVDVAIVRFASFRKGAQVRRDACSDLWDKLQINALPLEKFFRTSKVDVLLSPLCFDDELNANFNKWPSESFDAKEAELPSWLHKAVENAADEAVGTNDSVCPPPPTF